MSPKYPSTGFGFVVIVSFSQFSLVRYLAEPNDVITPCKITVRIVVIEHNNLTVGFAADPGFINPDHLFNRTLTIQLGCDSARWSHTLARSRQIY